MGKGRGKTEAEGITMVAEGPGQRARPPPLLVLPGC